MNKELEYYVKTWKQEKRRCIENYNLWEPKLKSDIESYILRLSQEDIHLIEEYGDLASTYGRYGELRYIVENLVVEYNKNCYLSAKSIELCQILLKRGVDAFDKTKERILGGARGNYAAIQAIIAGDTNLALALVGEKSFIGSLLQKRYDDVFKYQLPYIDRTYIKQALMGVVENDEKVLKESIEARIKMLRKEARLDVTLIDEYGIGILKLAKRRGMNCDIHVAELPEELLEDTPIDFDNWKLPIPERVQKILES